MSPASVVAADRAKSGTPGRYRQARGASSPCRVRRRGRRRHMVRVHFPSMDVTGASTPSQWSWACWRRSPRTERWLSSGDGTARNDRSRAPTSRDEGCDADTHIVVTAAWAAVPGRGETPVNDARPPSPANVAAYERAAAVCSLEQVASSSGWTRSCVRSDAALDAAQRNTAAIGEAARKAESRAESLRYLAARAAYAVTNHMAGARGTKGSVARGDDSRIAAGAYGRATADDRRTLVAHADLTGVKLTKARETTTKSVQIATAETYVVPWDAQVRSGQPRRSPMPPRLFRPPLARWRVRHPSCAHSSTGSSFAASFLRGSSRPSPSLHERGRAGAQQRNGNRTRA